MTDESAGGPRAALDAAAVVVTFELDETGEEIARIGEEHVTPLPGETPREAALRIVAGRCAELARSQGPGRGTTSLRVDALGVSGVMVHLLVHADGHVDVVGEKAPEPDEYGVWPDAEGDGPPSTFAPVPALTVPERVPVGGPVPPAPTPQAAAPLPPEALTEAIRSVSAGPTGTSSSVTSAFTAALSAGSRGVRRLRGPGDLGRGLGTALAVLATLALVVALVLWTDAMRRSPSADDVVRTGDEAGFPTAPPDTFTGQGRWVAGPLDPEGGPAVTVGDAVAVVTHDRRLVMVEAGDGTVRWSSALPEGPLSGGVHRSRIDGADVLTLRVGDRLAWWSVDDGQEHGLDLPAGAGVSHHGATPLVGIDASTVASVADGALREVVVPAGAFPLAAREDGTVTAASSQGWWHLRPGQAPGLPTPWERTEPLGATTRIAGYAGSSIVLLHPPDDTGRPHLVVHTDREEDVRVSFRAPYVPGPEDAWVPSPTDTWGVLGRTLVDIENGRVADLGDWRTVHVADDRTIGILGGQAVAAGPALPRGVLTTDAFPEAMTPSGAVVRHEGADGQVVHLLPQAQNRPSPTTG